MQHENKERNRHIIIFIIGMIIVIDYINEKTIPNILFMDNFSKENVASYWTGVISTFVAYLSLSTLQQTADKYFFEKKNYIEMQKKDAIRRYQDLLKTAIEIFHNKYDNEYESLFAVQIVKNIIDLSCNIENGRKNISEIEPFRIISLEGAFGILKNHLDKVLASEWCSESTRQDIRAIIQIIYDENYLKRDKHLFDKIGIYKFTNLSLDIAYFDGIKMQNAEFEQVKFYGNTSGILLYLSENNNFLNCNFECEFNVFLEEYTTLTLNNCNLQEIRIYPERKNNDKIKRSGTKNLIITNCVIEGFTNLSDNNFDSLKISDSIFKNTLHMHSITVDSELTVERTKFEGTVDFQSSVIRWQMKFTDTVCSGMFYFWDSLLLKRTRLFFDNFFVQDFESGNLSVSVYEDPHDIKAKSQKFGDLYKLVWIEEKKMNRLELKRKENS